MEQRRGGSEGNASESDWHALKGPRTQRRRVSRGKVHGTAPPKVRERKYQTAV